MKEKFFTITLGVAFTIPTLYEALKLPFQAFEETHFSQHFRNDTSIQMKDDTLITDDFSIVSGEFGVMEDQEASSIPEEKVWVPFEKQEEKLTHFRYQVQSEMENGYSGDFHFDGTTNYDAVKGISTFRGTNYRQNAFYGNLTVTEKRLEKIWTNNLGQTDSWSGIGWNGQPAIIQWNDEVKQQMNLYDEMKQTENFTEVIAGGLDSIVHFYDLATGKESRPAIHVPSSIKGSVTVDPRGYPLLYVGQGIDAVHGVAVKFGYHIFSLITGEELFFINGRDKFAYIGWGAFDGNPVIDAKTDTMILPGENGVLYIVNLHTDYDTINGTIAIHPVVTRYRYTQNGRAGGMENAVAIYQHYAFFTNNYGVVQCLDLNTLTPVWSYDMGDDCDATIGLEEEGDDIFLYVSCEVDKRQKASPAYTRKLNGRTGEVIWEYSVTCQFDGNNNGGVLSSPVIGKGAIQDLVIINYAKVSSLYNGKMVALNKSTGEMVWEKDLTYYSWSSPVAVYTETEEAYLVFGDFGGMIHLINAQTGETVTTLQTGGGNMEGSPVVFDNHIIIGTRGKKIFRIDIL